VKKDCPPEAELDFSPGSPVTLNGETLITPESQHERNLVAAAQADLERFLERYDRYFHGVWAYVIRRERNRSEAEYVTSEVSRRALEKLGPAMNGEAPVPNLDGRSIVVSDPVGALAHLQLGRALALSGDKAKAKTAYQDFLTLWNDADGVSATRTKG
jgi:hypothetical protein